jgi:WD40 repeat protein
LLFAILANQASAQFYYGLHQVYGKNRVQYNEFNWSFYRFERYDIYHYKTSRPIAKKAAEIVDRNLKQLEGFMDERLAARFQVLVFTSLTDLKQSNVNASDDQAYNTGGVTRSAGTRMFVYFNGDYNHLEHQIRAGLLQLLLSHMVYGGFTNSLKNSTLLNLPDWYVEGLISYVAEPWSPHVDQQVRDGFTSGLYKRFNTLTGDDAKYAGHSWWNFIAETYGRGVVKNLIYMTIVNRSIEQAFQYVLGVNLESGAELWRDYYEKQYANSINSEFVYGAEVIKGKKEHKIYNIQLSPNGRHIAYVDNILGEYKVFTYNISQKKKKKVVRHGYKIAQNSDFSYPLLAWHPNNRTLAMILEDKGFVWIYFMDIEKNKIEKKKLFGFDKVLEFSYSPDGKELVMAAIKQGQSDIFIFDLFSSVPERITHDDYRDEFPAFINGGKQLVFASNRSHDTIIIKEKVSKFRENNDLFIYDRNSKNKELLWRITNTPDLNETSPQEYQPYNISYLSDKNGIQDQYILAIDSFIAYVDTSTHYEYTLANYRITESTRNIQEQDFSSEQETIARLIFLDKKYRIYFDELVDASYLKEALSESSTQDKIKAKNDLKKLASEADDNYAAVLETQDIDIEDYTFDERILRKYDRSAIPKKPKTKVLTPGTKKSEMSKEEVAEFDIPGSRLYNTSFYRDNFTVQIDFLFDNPQYQDYTAGLDNSLLNSGFNVNFKIGTFDLLNDYRIVLGLRTDFQPVAGLSLSPNSEIMLGAVNNKHRIDQQFAFYRRSQLRTAQQFFFLRFLTYEGHYTLSYPFTEVSRVSLTGGYRHSRRIVLSDSPLSLPLPDQYKQHIILRASYVFDNTRKKGLNLYNGVRFKLFTEYYENVTKSNTGLHTLGIDFRQYAPVTKDIIWANRLAIGTSFGKEKLLHYLGGVDNQINPKFNGEIDVDQTQDYLFQTVVTNMRGFRQNIRNGNTFAVINSELRIPVFKMLINRPIKSDFISNFQAIGFADVGSAWNGPNPFSDENAFNNEVIGGDNPSLTVVLDRQNNPIVGGTGFGLRTRLLGYFVRLDWAWGIQDGRTLPRIFYFSLSTDF